MEQASAAHIVVVADSVGIRPVSTTTELRDLIAGLDFFCLDVSVDDETIRADVLAQVGLDASDVSWALRFGQALRVVVDRRGLRVVTWLAAREGDVAEVHLLCSERHVLTIWSGDPAALDEARAHFADRVGELKKSRFQAAAIVLQLLLGTLDQAISRLDMRLDEMRQRLQPSSVGVEFATVRHQLQRLQSRWAGFDRYTSAVRSAMVGVEAVPGMDARGAQELNDYADQVEDTGHRAPAARLESLGSEHPAGLRGCHRAAPGRPNQPINAGLAHLPSHHVPHRLLRHELRLDERTRRKRVRVRRAGCRAARL